MNQLLSHSLPDELTDDQIHTVQQQADHLAKLQALSEMDRVRVTVNEAQSAAAKQKAQQEKNEHSLKVLKDLTVVLPLLGSLYTNGLRRAAMGRYDLAALMLYRCLELVSQQRLATHDIVPEQANYRKAWRQIPGLQDRYTAIKARQDKRREPWNTPKPHYDLPGGKIQLFNGYILLAALNDPLLEGYDIGNIEECTEARNISILAHGYRPITETEYIPFRDVVNDVLNRFLVLVGQNLKDLENTYRFINPFTPAP